MLKVSLGALVLVAIFSSGVAAQSTHTLEAGESLKNGDGTVMIVNHGPGKVKVRYEGELQQTEENVWVLDDDGEVVDVRNPRSGGSKELDIDTGGNDFPILLQCNGKEENEVYVAITGGNAQVEVSGDHNQINISGTDNHINFKGNNNQGFGTSSSSGTLESAGTGNTFSPGGGSWTVL